jgi:hypothetical protein
VEVRAHDVPLLSARVGFSAKTRGRAAFTVHSLTTFYGTEARSPRCRD